MFRSRVVSFVSENEEPATLLVLAPTKISNGTITISKSHRRSIIQIYIFNTACRVADVISYKETAINRPCKQVKTKIYTWLHLIYKQFTPSGSCLANIAQKIYGKLIYFKRSVE